MLLLSWCILLVLFFFTCMQQAMADRYAPGQEGVCVPEEEWESRRQCCDEDFVCYYPSIFHGRTMRSMHEFVPEEMLTTTHDLERLRNSLALPHPRENKRTSLWGGRRSSMRASNDSLSTLPAMSADERQAIVFVCIENEQLPARLAADLGSVVAALVNVEVLILKAVGFSDMLNVRGTESVVYLDVSGNNIGQLDQVLRVVRECTRLVSADFEGNPCLSQPDAVAKILAASSWTMLHLNGRPVEMRRKVAAIIKHGDPAARTTLCYEVWDAQVCNSHGVSGKRNMQPSQLPRLELPAAGLSVFHVGLFTSLTLLDLSGNQLSKLRGRGLAQLEQLRRLSVSHNLLTDPWELTPILALPAITFLSIVPQRVSVDQLTRAGPPGSPGALYRRLAILLTLHSVGSEERAGLNYLDHVDHCVVAQCANKQRLPLLPLDAPPSTWQAVSIDERLEALEEVYLHKVCLHTNAAKAHDHPETRSLHRGQAAVEAVEVEAIEVEAVDAPVEEPVERAAHSR